MLKNLIISNKYYDSATLMLLTNQIKENLNLKTNEISVMMGTEMNKKIMENSDLLNEIGKGANSGDILIGIKSALDNQKILNMVDSLLNQEIDNKNSEQLEINSVDDGIKNYKDTNFAVVSLPGSYAAREVKKLLKAKKHVLLFSDNIDIKDEIELKDLAIENDLLMMGPDCGTAIIKGVGLGFSNRVNKGSIGIVAASGTGLQEVATIISNNSGGISYAFGTGGRDIKESVGGRMMLYCLDLLIKDEETETIVIVSKPPSKNVIEKIINKVKNIKKPVVACFLGEDISVLQSTNIVFCETLEETAIKVLELISVLQSTNIVFCETLEETAIKVLELNGIKYSDSFDMDKILKMISSDKKNGYIRGVYCGGTLAYEALLMLEKQNIEIYSNLSKCEERRLKVNDKSLYNTILDMGEDEYTVGKPHPMINSSSRNEQLLKEAEDESVGIIIADIELGYGANDFAADELGETIKQIKTMRSDLVFIVVICGSKQDYQDYNLKKNLLIMSGAIVVNSNAQGVRLAIELSKRRG